MNLFRIFCVCPLEKVVTQLTDDRSKNTIIFLFQNITILPEGEFEMKNLIWRHERVFGDYTR
jgi:hypothetical protein